MENAMESMDDLCQFNLAFPARVEEELLDFVLDHPEWVSGFSVVAAEGFGSSAALHTAIEQVRGRAARRLLVAILPRAHADALVAALQRDFAVPQMVYWITPVQAFGRFA